MESVIKENKLQSKANGFCKYINQELVTNSYSVSVRVFIYGSK